MHSVRQGECGKVLEWYVFSHQALTLLSSLFILRVSPEICGGEEELIEQAMRDDNIKVGGEERGETRRGRMRRRGGRQGEEG